MFNPTLKLIIKKTLSVLILLFVIVAPGVSRATLRGNTLNANIGFSNGVSTPLETGLYRAGATFPIDLYVNTRGQNVNVVAAYINYNPAYFSITIDGSASVFPMEQISAVDAVTGKISIVRSTTTSVNTTNGKVVTLNVTSLSATTPSADNFTFDFTAGDTNLSNVFLNDQSGTPVLSGVYDMRLTTDGTPPPNISSFAATAGEQQVVLSWTNPVSSDFSGVKILSKITGYPANETDGIVVYDGTGTGYTDLGLLNGTVYYYRAFSRDAVLNYSSGVSVTATPRDMTPPAAITSLTATPLTARTARLDWTSVGDNGTTGTAASYEVRYSTTAITSANFSSANLASGAPIPKISGQAETFTISSLSGYTTYYFAVKAVDAGGNSGVISNLPTARTFKTADLNNNLYVNAQDLSILMSYWGNTSRPAADANQDGYVNAQDLSIMMSQWGNY